MAEETNKEIENKKEALKSTKVDHFPFALLTGGNILNAVGLLIIWQGQQEKDALTQVIMLVSAIAVFMLGGTFLHTYNKLMRK